MTSMLVFDPTALSAAVTALQNAAGEIGSKLAVLESQSQTLSSQWSGDAREAYRVAYASWTAEFAELTRLLDQAQAALDAAAERYAAAESRIESAWRV